MSMSESTPSGRRRAWEQVLLARNSQGDAAGDESV